MTKLCYDWLKKIKGLVDFQVKMDIFPEPQLKKLYSGWLWLIQLENYGHIRLQLSIRWQ